MRDVIDTQDIELYQKFALLNDSQKKAVFLYVATYASQEDKDLFDDMNNLVEEMNNNNKKNAN